LIDSFDVVLFDNDGVLVDTEPLFLRATREILATVGVDLDAETYRAVSLARGASVFDLVSARGFAAHEIAALRARRDDRYTALIRAGVDVLPGVRATLARLRGVRPLAIVTSSGRAHFDAIHAQTDLLPHFDFVLAEGDYARHKPHPDPYLEAARRFGVAPERCLVVEDTERGLASAHAAGMHCIAIPHALSRGSDFGRAVRILESMVELVAVLGLDARGA
jgi:HAD superfamily hydrolase (TIGR01509 family)